MKYWIIPAVITIAMWIVAWKKRFNLCFWILPLPILGLLIVACLPSAAKGGIDDARRKRRRRTANLVGGVLTVVTGIIPICITFWAISHYVKKVQQDAAAGMQTGAASEIQPWKSGSNGAYSADLMIPSYTAKGQQGTTLSIVPLAHFQFNGDAKNVGSGEAMWELENIEFRKNALYLNGIYDGQNPYRAICHIPSLNYERFAVAVRCRTEDFTRSQPDFGFNRRCNLLTGGAGFRWFGMQRSEAGNVVITFNDNHFRREISKTTIEPNEWAVIACSVDIPGRKVLVCVNRARVAEIQLPEGFALDVLASPYPEYVSKEKEFTFTNYNAAEVFHGLIDDFMVYDRALSREELESIPLYP